MKEVINTYLPLKRLSKKYLKFRPNPGLPMVLDLQLKDEISY